MRCPGLIPTAILLLAAGGASAGTVNLPLDPAGLAGPGIFTAAPRQVARAAEAAGLTFTAAPKPLPPQVILPLATPAGTGAPEHDLLFWRGDMLPDQLAPAETGTLIRKRREADGTWHRLGARHSHPRPDGTHLVPVARATEHFTLPATIIATPYQLGHLGSAPVRLELWRSPEEDSVPVGGALVLSDPPPALLDAFRKLLPPFPSQAAWAAEFEALSP